MTFRFCTSGFICYSFLLSHKNPVLHSWNGLLALAHLYRSRVEFIHLRVQVLRWPVCGTESIHSSQGTAHWSYRWALVWLNRIDEYQVRERVEPFFCPCLTNLGQIREVIEKWWRNQKVKASTQFSSRTFILSLSCLKYW